MAFHTVRRISMLAGLVLLFAAPLFLAEYLVHHADRFQFTTVNRGELVSPVRSLEGEAFPENPWVILQLEDDSENYALAEQIRLLSGKNMHKIAVRKQSDLKLSEASQETLAELNASFVLLNADHAVILKYPKPFVAPHLNKDLKRLLYVEHLANQD